MFYGHMRWAQWSLLNFSEWWPQPTRKKAHFTFLNPRVSLTLLLLAANIILLVFSNSSVSKKRGQNATGVIG